MTLPGLEMGLTVVFDTCKGTGGLEEVAARGARPPVPFSMSRTSVDDMRRKGTSSFTRFCVGWVRPPGRTNYIKMCTVNSRPQEKRFLFSTSGNKPDFEIPFFQNLKVQIGREQGQKNSLRYA